MRVECWWRRHEDTVRGGELPLPGDAPYVGDDAGVGDEHRLGLAGGARGLDDVDCVRREGGRKVGQELQSDLGSVLQLQLRHTRDDGPAAQALHRLKISLEVDQQQDYLFQPL